MFTLKAKCLITNMFQLKKKMWLLLTLPMNYSWAEANCSEKMRCNFLGVKQEVWTISKDVSIIKLFQH